MGNRNVRVNELIKREVSLFVRRHLQAEAVGVTITDVEVTNDYKSATVFFSMLSQTEDAPAMAALLNGHAQAINQHLRKAIILRNIPRVRFQFDTSMERGTRILELLDEIDTDQKTRPE